MDRRRDIQDGKHRHRALAHLWRDTHPRARGLPHHARRAHDASAAAAKLLHKQSLYGCAA
jgi:hypothetical protein